MLNLINRRKILTIYPEKRGSYPHCWKKFAMWGGKCSTLYLWGRILPPLPWTSVLFIQNIEYDFKSKTNLR